jgi:hypothetical protein
MAYVMDKDLWIEAKGSLTPAYVVPHSGQAQLPRPLLQRQTMWLPVPGGKNFFTSILSLWCVICLLKSPSLTERGLKR